MNVSDIKQNNQNKIYFYLRKKGSATKQTIAYDLQLSLPTVSRNLELLVREGLLRSDAKVESKSEGRKPIAYSYIADAKIAIGLDITRNHIKCAIIDLNGEMIYYTMVDRPFRREDAYMRMLGTMVEEGINQANVDRNRILGVGIAIPGLVSPDGRHVVHGRVIDNEGMDCATFAKYIPYPAKLIHDSSAAGFAENWVSPEIQNAYYIGLFNSVGSTVILNRALYMANPLYSSEVGHLTLVPDGKPCYCGQKGCVEEYCKAEVLSGHTNNDLDAFFQQLHQGEERLISIWDRYLDDLSCVISNVRMLFGCAIIIGGYIGPYIRDYLDVLRKKVDERNAFFEESSSYLLPCKTGIESVAIGSALFYIDEYLGPLRKRDLNEWTGPRIDA